MLYMISVIVNTQKPLSLNSLLPADTWNPAAWKAKIEQNIQQLIQGPTPITMGHLESFLEAQAKELMRPFLEKAAQQLIQSQALCCPLCHKTLHIEARNRDRDIHSVFGSIKLLRDYGWCPRCRERFYPGDIALGLNPRAEASPRVQEICALMVINGPAAQAQQHVERLTGMDLSPSTMHREALRQGQRAIELRQKDIALSKLPGGVAALAARANPPKSPFTLVIEMDAWNIRERDEWGRTEELRKKNVQFSRWHWVYVGTIFRLDQRGLTAGKRPVITERGYVATRQGLESFEEQLYVEALQRGLLQADKVLIIADGAVWIWNLAKDRFKDATQLVDLFHIREHLWAVANEIYGQGSSQAAQWVTPLFTYLNRRKDGALDVITQLSSLRNTMIQLTQKQQEMLEREINYFKTHKDRMNYKKAKALGEPVGSGAIESTCRQYERRFKIMGQFWSLPGDQSLLALETLHKNDRWQKLFPHAQ